MVRIQTRCPDCGKVRIAAEEALLTVFTTAGGVPSGMAIYDFACPSCGDDVSIGIDRRTTSLLIRAGVPVTVELDPRDRHPSVAGARLAALRHPENPPDGPPLTPDDLLDLHLALDRTDWFEYLLEESGYDQSPGGVA